MSIGITFYNGALFGLKEKKMQSKCMLRAYCILANSTDFGSSLPTFKAVYRLLPGGVNATNYKSSAFASLNLPLLPLKICWGEVTSY